MRLSSHSSLPSWTLTRRQLCDLECLLNNTFAPLTGFMTKADYLSCIERLQLSDGRFWPMPITLDVPPHFADKLGTNQQIVLQNNEGTPLAVMTVREMWWPDKQQEAELVYGTLNTEHPGVDYLINQSHAVYIGGDLTLLQLLVYYDFQSNRLTPAELINYFKGQGIERVVAFQTRNPMHKAHYELTRRAAEQCQAHLLIHPVVGETKPGDINYYTRVRCYQEILSYYTPGSASLALLPLAMRMAGPREALWHALIRKNYGCTHFIVGRDHAGPGNDSQGRAFYRPEAAQQMALQYQDRLDITIVPFAEMVYVRSQQCYLPITEVSADEEIGQLSGTQLRACLHTGTAIPEWFTFPAVAKVLHNAYPNKQQQGFTVFFTGLSGAGKSTLANALLQTLLASTGRQVTLLDGDQVRQHLSSELGFSRQHRDLNIMRIGYVAGEITKHRGIAICAPIAPYSQARRQVRTMIEQYGGFIEIHVATPLEICEQRDPKGLYQKARAGLLSQFTGIDDPYEVPLKPELSIDTSQLSVAEAITQILLTLQVLGFLANTN